jgi:DNA primase
MVCGSSGSKENYRPPERLVLRKVMALSNEVRPLSESYLDLFDAKGAGSYWSERFTEDACRAFRLGYDSDKGKSVYPLRDPQGALIGVVTRNHAGIKPKYRYPYGVKTSELLFNIHAVGDTVVMVEGAPDVIALQEAGVPAVGAFGARLYEAQAKLLLRQGVNKVLVAFDMDFAGIKGSREAVNTLMKHGVFAKRVRWDDKYNDPGEMPVDVRKSVFGSYTLV